MQTVILQYGLLELHVFVTAGVVALDQHMSRRKRPGEQALYLSVTDYLTVQVTHWEVQSECLCSSTQPCSKTLEHCRVSPRKTNTEGGSLHGSLPPSVLVFRGR